MNKALNIMFIIPWPWSPRLGASRVSLELSNHLEARGHRCAKWSAEDALIPAGRINRLFTKLRFQRAIQEVIRQSAGIYDVVQVEHDYLPFSRTSYRFPGMIISKSNGLRHLYRRQLSGVPDGRENRNLGLRIAGRFAERLAERIGGGFNADVNGFAIADQVHVLTKDEQEVVAGLGYGDKCFVLENGLNEDNAAHLKLASDPNRRFSSRTMVFIGHWSFRKGRRELPLILRAIRKEDPGIRLRLLGTGGEEHSIRSKFDVLDHNAIEIVRDYDPGELPKLLADARIGLFTSYVEGFPLGMLEMMVAGLPVVSWDVPGTRVMLQQLESPYMAAPGDVRTTVKLIADMMARPCSEYRKLCDESIRISGRYRWAEIAATFERMAYQWLDTSSISRYGTAFLRSPQGI